MRVHDRVIVQNDPINWYDPDGLSGTTTFPDITLPSFPSIDLSKIRDLAPTLPALPVVINPVTVGVAVFVGTVLYPTSIADEPNVNSPCFREKYEKLENPNKRKGADERKKTGERERNVGHPDGEEHSRVPKGSGGRIRR